MEARKTYGLNGIAKIQLTNYATSNNITTTIYLLLINNAIQLILGIDMPLVNTHFAY
jgi:hypothetical protein